MIIFFVFFVLVMCFGFVLMYGAPYVPTHTKAMRDGITMLDLKRGQTLYELGCGDGRVLKIAAEQGIRGVGYELNPILVVIAKIITWRHRKNVEIVWGSFWKADLTKADGVFMFLHDRFMARIGLKLDKELRAKTPVVSYVFKIPTKKIIQQKDGLLLYRLPSS